jgi:3',5'-cyclic-AMP phosphodiesterase
MRFIHITDTHIGPTPGHTMMGGHPLATLEALVNEINCLPFEPDFILHTGDVTDDGSEAAYKLARSVLQRLKAPIFYLVGNHDNSQNLQRVLLGKTTVSERHDYYVKLGGVGLAVLDSHIDNTQEGSLTEDQLEALRDLCKPSGPPLIIALHHQPVLMDVEWLDHGWDGYQMILQDRERFLDAIAPARDRIRGVFFGHIHRSSEVMRKGILFSTPPSGCVQTVTWPSTARPEDSTSEQPGFNVVTVTDEQTIIRQHTFKVPKGR